MKNVFLVTCLAVLSLLSTGAYARLSVPVQSPQNATFPVIAGAAPLTTEKVRDAVATAGSARGWQVVDEQPGVITLHNLVRGRHDVTVKVFYDTVGFHVDYVDTKNLNYAMRHGVPYIHPKYNIWVQTLIQDILAKASH